MSGNGWHTWPDWMSHDTAQMMTVCDCIRLPGLLDLAVMLDTDTGLTPPEARQRFGLSLEEWEPVESAITAGLIERAASGAVLPAHLRRWLDTGRACQ